MSILQHECVCMYQNVYLVQVVIFDLMDACMQVNSHCLRLTAISWKSWNLSRSWSLRPSRKSSSVMFSRSRMKSATQHWGTALSSSQTGRSGTAHMHECHFYALVWLTRPIAPLRFSMLRFMRAKSQKKLERDNKGLISCMANSCI